MEKATLNFNKKIRPVVVAANGIGMVSLAAMMFLTAADVVLRYFFNKPITGDYELVQFMLAITVALGLAYCGLEKGHVTIDVVTSRLPRRARAIIDSFVGLLGILTAAITTWQACFYIITLHDSQVLSTVLLIPVYPFVAVTALGLALYTLVLISHLFEFISQGTQK